MCLLLGTKTLNTQRNYGKHDLTSFPLISFYTEANMGNVLGNFPFNSVRIILMMLTLFHVTTII